MTTRIVLSVLVAALMTEVSPRAQALVPGPMAESYVDAVQGLSLEQAIARALDREPSLRAARRGIDVARGAQVQASLKPNPSVSFDRREEPAGPDNLTTVGVEWPLDLFRRAPRVAVADREVGVTQLAIADRERLLAADVRARYGDVVATVRDLAILDEFVSTTRQQHALLRSRVEEGSAPPLERDEIDVELRRLESDRSQQTGRAQGALFALKRVLGMRATEPLAVRDTLEDVVRREAPATVARPDDATVIDRRADVREAAARVAVADAKIEHAKAEGRFDMSVSASYMRMDAGFPQRGVTPDGRLEPVRGVFHYLSGGVTVTVPVLNRNQGAVIAATAEHAGAQSSYEAARLGAESDLASARARDEYAHQAVRTITEAQALARQNLMVIGQSYELGRVTIFDVLAEQRRYLDLERAYTEALKGAYDARTALNQAIGGVQ